MKRLTRFMSVMVLCCAVLMGASNLYAGDGGIKVGSLEVRAIEGTRHNLIIKSSVDVEAVFTDSKGNKEYYIGEMGQKLGVDLSYKTKEVLGYLVFSASSDYKTGSYAMQGKYFGQKATAALGIGTGVQILLGGFDKSFSLQPIALEGVEGAGASLGLGYLYLQKDHRK